MNSWHSSSIAFTCKQSICLPLYWAYLVRNHRITYYRNLLKCLEYLFSSFPTWSCESFCFQLSCEKLLLLQWQHLVLIDFEVCHELGPVGAIIIPVGNGRRLGMGSHSFSRFDFFYGLLFFVLWLINNWTDAPPKIIRPNKTKTSVETFDHLLHIVHKVLISYQCVPGENFQALSLILSAWCHTSLAEDFPKYPSLWAYPCRAARPQVPPCPNEPLLLMTKQLVGLLQGGPPEHFFLNSSKEYMAFSITPFILF